MNENDDTKELGITIEQINIGQEAIGNEADLGGLMILPTKNVVLFPEVTISLTIKRTLSEITVNDAVALHKPVGIVCQINPEEEWPTIKKGLYGVGVIADVLKVLELPDGEKTAIVRGRERFKIIGNSRKKAPHTGILMAKVEVIPEAIPLKSDRAFTTMIKKIKQLSSKIAAQMGPGLANMLSAMSDPGSEEMLINHLATNLPFDPEEKQEMLNCNGLKERASMLLSMLSEKEQEMELTRDIMEKARVDMTEDQRRAFMQRQMDVLYDELYGGIDDATKLEKKAKEMELPEQVKSTFDRELAKLRHLNPQNPDYYVVYSYLDTLLSLPWNKVDELNSDFSLARNVLDSDHHGLEKVKERILEQIAAVIHNPKGKSPILCLVGPPGVGKTSLGKSVAASLGLAYQRVSLGGLHDEAEIRGHRRTYIGAMPGRIIDAVKRAGTANPVLVLDEVDKIGADYKGDPSSALLEVLDPEQNCHFHDNYIDVDFDLSRVLFIATANTLSTVPRPLIDRMEVITLSGYLPEEKLEIARRHLLPRIEKDINLQPGELSLSDDAINAIIDSYTSESGVRQLEKRLSSLSRKKVMAKVSGSDFPAIVEPADLKDLLGLAPYMRDKYEGNDFPGVVTGLAWTEVGGEILLAEASLTAGKGKETLTGNLGDVMKESATIAYQWVKAHADQLGIDPEAFEKYNLHIHFPEGAIPKDGPSAGITIATAIASAFTGRKVRERIAMTGEITLRGKVLPVGGIKEKILAAKRAGITDIILSADNRKDIEDIDARYIAGLSFHFVDTMLDVASFALLP